MTRTTCAIRLPHHAALLVGEDRPLAVAHHRFLGVLLGVLTAGVAVQHQSFAGQFKVKVGNQGIQPAPEARLQVLDLLGLGKFSLVDGWL
jgi:hypothetical protein